MLEDSAPAAPPGWYPGPDGKQRYWDGRAWLQIPPPEQAQVEAPLVDQSTQERASGSRRWIWVAAAVLALIGVVVGVNAVNNAREAREAAAVAAQETKAKEDLVARQRAAAAAAAAAEAERQANEAKEAQEAKEAKEAEETVDRAIRGALVKEIEKSVKKMAKSHVKSGLINGPIVDVSCEPVAGGSVDDLSEETAVFQCFAANKKRKDGSASGYYYNSTINWDSGEYTYGYGQP